LDNGNKNVSDGKIKKTSSKKDIDEAALNGLGTNWEKAQFIAQSMKKYKVFKCKEFAADFSILLRKIQH
jgi:hypothetical protein